MKIETFLYNLHFDTEKVFPTEWRVNWEDSPLPYKLYRGLPEIPLTMEKGISSIEYPTLDDIGIFLWHVYGVTQYTQQANWDSVNAGSVIQSLRRFVPSGGALYPNELYLYLKKGELPEGIYHYNNAHHRLVLLRAGNYDSYISKSIGNEEDINGCFGVLFLSTFFWKNFFKYNNFSYRLQGLDAGAVIGQLLETGARMGISANVCYQFLDHSLNHLIGLNEEDETVYAVIPLSLQQISYRNENFAESIYAEDLCREIPAVKHTVYQRSKKILDYPLIKKLTAASKFDSTDVFTRLEKNTRVPASASLETIMLPNIRTPIYDFTSVCRERHSPESDFVLGEISLNKISCLLNQTFNFPYLNDLDDTSEGIQSRFFLFGCFYQVEGIPDGAYYYDFDAHTLRKISFGDFRAPLQSVLTAGNVNLFQVPICFHIVGEKDHYIGKFGYRGHRIQQMEAGILLQRLLLASSALGLGGHPLLGFNGKRCDELYQLKDKTCLIQIPVGPYLPRAWLKGSLGAYG